MTSRIARFGAFEFDCAALELRKQGSVIELQNQPSRVLMVLIARAGQIVTRDELRREIWTEDTFVEFDRSLATAIMKIRQALGDSATHPRFLETVPKRGYRFIAPVEGLPAPSPQRHRTAESRAAAELPIRGWPHAALALALVGAILLVSAGGWFVVAHSSARVDPDWLIRPVTRFAGQESAPGWSPDGSFITFSRMSRGDSNIFVMPASGGPPVQLTHSPADDMRPRWSPDGRHIAYLSDERRTKQLYLLPASGGPPRMLADTGLSYLDRFADSWKSFGASPWSPDSRDLLFSRLQPDGAIAVWKLRLESGEEKQITFPPHGCKDQLASWSFDGQMIAFSRDVSGRGSLWSMPAAGGEPRLLLKDAYDNFGPSFSTDSRRVVFTSDRAGTHNVWEIDIASRDLRRLTSGPGVDLNPVVGRTGGILFAHHEFDLEIYRKEIETGIDEQLTSEKGWNYQPRFSPDGTRIIYHSNRTGNFDLWLLEVADKSLRQMTTHSAADLAADWSPDGSEIAFLSDRDGMFRLWALEVKHGTARRVLDKRVLAPQGKNAGVGQTIAPRWSPDGNRIAFLVDGDPAPEMWIVDPGGRGAQSLIAGVLAFDWYDASHLVYSRASRERSGMHELCLVNLGSRQERVLHRGPHVELAATRNGSAVSFASADSHFAMNLFVLLLARVPGQRMPNPAGSPVQVTDGRGLWHAHNGGWSPDGKSVLYARERHEGDLYVIENYR